MNSTKQVVKGTHGGSRPRSALAEIKKRQDGQKLALHEIIRNFGGLSVITRATATLLGEKDFFVQNWSNWRSRGRVPVNIVFKIGRALGVDPRVLNYKGASDMVEHYRSWAQVVNSTECFDSKTKKKILSFRSPE